MPEETSNQEQEFLFMQTVMMFQGMALQNLGKVMNPMTNKVERNLDHAKNFIDLIGMLEAKTKGNLNANEKRLLDHVLFELRMNYVDEVKKDAEKPEGATPPADAQDEKTGESEGGEQQGDAREPGEPSGESEQKP